MGVTGKGHMRFPYPSSQLIYLNLFQNIKFYLFLQHRNDVSMSRRDSEKRKKRKWEKEKMRDFSNYFERHHDSGMLANYTILPVSFSNQE